MNKKVFLNSSSINKDDFIKICLSPDNKLIPDLCDKLPGKSVWLPASKDLIVDTQNKYEQPGIIQLFDNMWYEALNGDKRRPVLCVGISKDMNKKKKGVVAVRLVFFNTHTISLFNSPNTRTNRYESSQHWIQRTHRSIRNDWIF